MIDRIQSCIDHIKSAIDVDPWAAELAETALNYYREHTKHQKKQEGNDNEKDSGSGSDPCADGQRDGV